MLEAQLAQPRERLGEERGVGEAVEVGEGVRDAHAVREGCNLLLLDEPSNDLVRVRVRVRVKVSVRKQGASTCW